MDGERAAIGTNASPASTAVSESPVSYASAQPKAAGAQTAGVWDGFFQGQAGTEESDEGDESGSPDSGELPL
jgi:hypothetical protein